MKAIPLFLAVLFTALGQLCAADAKPNIIFILADDLGYMDVGAFNSKTFYETPNIDDLAKRGMKFTQGYAACCVCSPTRGSIMTGKYPPRFGITDFIPGMRSGKLKSAPNADHLALEEVTIAESLRDAGYATFFAGKWHLGGGEFYPGAQGFPKELTNGEGAKGNVQFWYPKSDLPVPNHQNDPKTTERIVNEAVKFIGEHKDGPFYAYLPFLAVHQPIGARESRGEIQRESEERAAGCVRSGTRSPGAARAKQSGLCGNAGAARHRHWPRARGAGEERTHGKNRRDFHVRQWRDLDQRRLAHVECATARRQGLALRRRTQRKNTKEEHKGKHKGKHKGTH